MVREIGGSLNLKYVLESVVEGVSTVTASQRVVVWLVSDHEATLLPAHDSDPEADDATRSVELGTGIIGRAAKYGRTTTGTPAENEDAGHLAVPLIIGARVVGVLELGCPGTTVCTTTRSRSWKTLSIHAAAALEAARLHQTTSHASEHDALTRLANRRRLEADLATGMRPQPPLRPAAGTDHARPRPLQAGQRHLRAHEGRRGCRDAYDGQSDHAAACQAAVDSSDSGSPATAAGLAATRLTTRQLWWDCFTLSGSHDLGALEDYMSGHATRSAIAGGPGGGLDVWRGLGAPPPLVATSSATSVRCLTSSSR